MRAAERLPFIVCCLISAVICIAIYHARPMSQAPYAVGESIPLGLRGTISATSTEERGSSDATTARRSSLDEAEITERLATTRTTGDILEAYANLRRKNELLLDGMGIHQMNARFAWEIDSRNEKREKDEVARLASRSTITIIIAIASVLAISIGASGTWFNGYISYKNYLLTIAKDAAAAMALPNRPTQAQNDSAHSPYGQSP